MKLDHFKPLSKDFFKDEFQKKNFLFDSDQPSYIASAQCGNFQLGYVLLRAFMIISITSNICIHLAYFKSEVMFLLLSPLYWRLFWRLVYTVAHFVAAVHLLRVGGEITYTPLGYKISWVLYNVDVAVTINHLQFAFLSSSFFEVEHLGAIPNAALLLTSIYTVDASISGTPIRILHFYIAIIVSLVYKLIIIFYWAGGGGFIYDIADWNKDPATAFIWYFMTTFIAAPTIHASIFLVYWLRVMLHKYICCCCDPDFEYPDERIGDTGNEENEDHSAEFSTRVGDQSAESSTRVGDHSAEISTNQV